MDSPHTRQRIVGGGAAFERGGAAVRKIAFDAAMFRGMIAVEDGEMAFDAAMIHGMVAVEDDEMEFDAAMESSSVVLETSKVASVCLRSAIESLSMFSCASVAATRVSEICSFAKSMSMFG